MNLNHREDEEPSKSYTLLQNQSVATNLETPTQAVVNERAPVASEQWAKERFSKTTSTRYKWTMAVFGLSFVLSIPTLISLTHLFPFEFSRNFAVSVLMGAIGFFGMIGTTLNVVWRVTHADSKSPLPLGEDVATVKLLLERQFTDYPRLNAIRDRLAVIMPLMTPQDIAQLTQRDYDIMNGYLHKVSNHDNRKEAIHRNYLMAILKLYAQRGDSAILKEVQRIAEGKTPASRRDPELKAAARDCLPRLQEGANLLNQQQTLLRGSQLPTASEILLRPAKSTPEVDETSLLRPSDSDELKPRN